MLIPMLAGPGMGDAAVQQDGLPDIAISLLRDTVIQSGSSLSFNRLTLENRSAQKKVLYLELDLPPGWSSPFGAARTVTLEPHGVLELPVRTAASHTTLSSVAYPVTLKITVPGTGSRVLKTFIARVQPNSRWDAVLAEPELRIDRFSSITYFMVRLSNSGNVDEELSMDLRTGLELSVPKKNHRIRLRAASDTTMHIGILTDPRMLDAFRNQRIYVDIRGKGAAPKVLVQQLFSSYSTFRGNASRWYEVPMYLELVGQNFTVPGQKQFYLNSAGSIVVGPDRTLQYTFRSDDYYDYDPAVSSRFAQVNYQGPGWKLSVGDQNEFSQFPIDGLGARVGRTLASGYTFDLLGVESRLGDARQFSLSQTFPVAGEHTITNTSLVSLDRAAQTDSYSSRTEFSSAAGRSSFQVSAGYGFETLRQAGQNRLKGGPLAGLAYYYQGPRIMIRSVSQLTSPYFAGLERGVGRSSGEVRLMARKFFMGALGEYHSRSVTIRDSLHLISLFGGQISEYGIRGGYLKGRQTLTLTASVLHQLQDSAASIPYRSEKLGLNAGLQLFSDINVSLSASYARSRSQAVPDAPAIGAFNAYGTVQGRRTGISFRADYGPFYYWDLMQYRDAGVYTRRYQVAPFAQRLFFNSALTTRVELNYMKDQAPGADMLAARVDLNLDLKKKGVSVRFYGNHHLSGRSHANYLNLSVRKNLNMPLPGLRKYRDLKVVLFRDLNLNGVLDTGDVPVSGAGLAISGQRFTTNAAGEAVYRNIATGDYVLELKQDDNVRGWIARDGFRQALTLDRSQTWYIPFMESRFISGRVRVVKDDFSNLVFSPASIRITAVNSRGEAFSTLTNGAGEFFLNLPGDTYLVQINSKVFSDEFRVLQDSFRVDLTGGNREHLVFEVREKKRAIHIRKSG